MPFVYRGAKTGQISFPLGGIGTGCIGLAGNGRLVDWEIFNRPNKGSVNGYSHFAVRAERAGEVVGARVLHGDLPAPHPGELQLRDFNGFGFGPRRESLAGLPHFEHVEFRGEFPLAELSFTDSSFPGAVRLRAFNPFIPGNSDDSSLPAAFFDWSITNTTEGPLTYTLVAVVANPLGPLNYYQRAGRNEFVVHDWGHALHLGLDGAAPHPAGHGDLTVATDAGLGENAAISFQHHWFRGTWFDNLEVYWQDLNRPGPFEDRFYDRPLAGMERLRNRDEGLLAVHVPVAPGEARDVRVVVGWSFPTAFQYWAQEPKPSFRNHYATRWADSAATARYGLEEWDRLLEETTRFKEALFASTLPSPVLDAVSSNLSILKSPTVLRLEDGTPYGWEGLHSTAGCCEGSCTHVWNYQQALPFLFPDLERSMRAADYRYNLLPSGAMPFRIQLPLGSAPSDKRPCADGQLGGVMKTFRDWKICGDDAWLRSLWPAVKSSLEYAWSPENPDRWDPERTGVLWGRQHHTLDMELFGPNAWLSGFYLGALKAGALMAEHLGDPETAAEYRALFDRGRGWIDRELWNGTHYVQRIDLGDRAILESFLTDDDVMVVGDGNLLTAYWDEEHGEIKHQLGGGSSIDQVVAQWHASLYGLGDLFDPDHVRRASATIFEHNFVERLRDTYNPCRVYSLDDEAGLMICAFPDPAGRPTIPVVYAQETMNGFEYAAASHMIMLGMVEQGTKCVEAVRKRYDGERRNPWNEFECGSNYARSMASYALLHAFSGFEFDATRGMIGFAPVCTDPAGRFRCFWSLGTAWGEFLLEPDRAVLRVLYGALSVAELRIAGEVKRYAEPRTVAGGEELILPRAA